MLTHNIIVLSVHYSELKLEILAMKYQFQEGLQLFTISTQYK